MDWPRLKTVLIVLFLVINIGLLANIHYTEYTKNVVPNADIDHVVTLLANNGVYVDEHTVPDRRDVLRGYTLTAVVEEKRRAAEALLGPEAEMLLSEDSTVAQYQKDDAQLWLWDDFRLLWEDSVFSGNVSRKQAQEIAEKLTAEGYGITSLPQWDNEEEGQYCFRQTLDGIPVEDTMLAVTLTEDGARAEGVWLMGRPQRNGEEQVTDGVTALTMYPILQQNIEGRTIESVQLIYRISSETAGNRIIPVYRVTDDAGQVLDWDPMGGRQIK